MDKPKNIPPSADNIKLGRFVAGALGFEPKIFPYYDEKEENQLDILSVTDPIDNSVNIYSTIGLSDHPNMIGSTNIPVELLLATYKIYNQASNVLSTCGFYIAKDKFECRPGAVFMKIMQFYYQNTEMKHIYFTAPFLWQDKLDQLKLDNKEVHFLLCIPISDKELEFKLKNGDDALESLLQQHEIDFYNFDRKSVL
ncbi:Suppressor of fused protein (SUFU) [Mucilaginibacter pineti]|uniref:Suppressor of fused protein (SUFU) n=1 Tax=Mucilaginibacter pineti TaxID=1391627 RepID=A0A1G7GGU4_9SPHI|nr:suppressor of fused domain protein [Mucilaginibacter pineti]SDE87347.1 Suppressor of fused protein (SUFU) [Mucilaginibacter pineti]